MSIIIRIRKKQVKNLFLNKFDISKLIFSYNISPACHIARATPLFRGRRFFGRLGRIGVAGLFTA
jgi:hypothetical protein